ncbi:MAG: 30S ribosomal protein S20 [Candidatus Edwardsbacteria bacterium RIFOXYD12_FULL_50_11]|uniref:Small ribosomal subunit protein bS20 n=1 Tax=Candidatus Edwardsbacteria bacterium GWF2_54_11 TaxID=1817851 RepID=A0A1F5RFX2_9BACT|nr:MAG: 30S ribosomal protein S20 [Candidatus Edwardsbacteria bacterium RifOxyC12_full_54_24]OGF06573.1 MAG: 30S ribosomal protein S20 [Candidatus Edwardsbacteria bacterium RifOxyA12_full_54_48]OGF11724.1 MAG: 30S ribosomal protein S20 [Candidatus Edwardsbacteria bacterium GWE2_54_12]OGF13268.1 MAG: 30S ribosomal protein S20 [Candidatus Edwardsbacteria bacterium GWF2_54_11]OGF17891.1 MAG: 30S ribosomal protein S20 [Candidatus Edwardsbacteria bacterium RIFOXYD12_FULL_50_11]OGJ18489.1 MAG: 30S r
MAEIKKVVKKKKSSVTKRARQALARRKSNSAVKSKMRKVVKKFKVEGKTPELLSTAYSEIDLAAKKGTIHKRTAARQKSRLAKTVNKKQPE